VRAELDLRRTVNLVQALLVATTACAAALVIGAAARLWLGTEVADSPRAGAKEQAEPAEQAHKARADYSAIFERNLFGSEPIVDTGSGAVAHADLLLRGTAQFGGTGYAVIENADSGLQQLFAVGDAVFDGPKLVAVEARTATLMRGGRKVVLEITESNAEAATGDSTAAGEGAAGNGIHQVGENRYLVDRGEVDHSIENLSTVVTQMRAVPYLKDGKSIGFRVFNIRAGSLFERMGLKNGDVIQAVNGTTLDDPTRALALLDEVQAADEISVDLLRDDHPNTLTYSIR